MKIAAALSFLLCVARCAADDSPSINWTELTVHAGGGKGLVQLANGDLLATRTAWKSNGVQVVCARSRDAGGHWEDISVIASENVPGADLGDGHLVQLPDGDVLYSYRHNFTRANAAGLRRYSIRVASSQDAGKTWQPHSVVAESTLSPAHEPDALRGLWSSFLLVKRDGTVHCCYDDEDTPHGKGFFRHQWLTMKIWDAKWRAWTNPVTVSRAHNRRHLSRDGMPSIVELAGGRLLCVFESVQTAPPHANCLRTVTSDDGGKTWSWRREERQIVYPTAKTNHLSVSPWIALLPGDRVVCVFATDEDRDVPAKSGTPPWAMQLDVKSIFSPDAGRTWSREACPIFAANHRAYMPGILRLRDGSLFITCFDYEQRAHRAFRGSVRPH